MNKTIVSSKSVSNETNPFDAKQIRDFVKQAMDEVGEGWSMLGARFQRALITERALHVMGGQVSNTVKTTDIQWLLQAMLAEAGLETK